MTTRASVGHGRFAEWFAWLNAADSGRTCSQFQLGQLLGSHQPTISAILNGTRGPGTALAAQIEKHSAPWPGGPIRVIEWSTFASVAADEERVAS